MTLKSSDYQKIFSVLAEQYPNPRSSLNYNSPFELLIAVILSAQATDISVNKASKDLFNIAPNPAKMLLLGEENLKNKIRSIGLYNTKAKNIIKLCQILINDYNSEIPQNRVDLEKLPGVGRKTANVVLNVAFKQPTLAVDTHIFRLANRTGMAVGKTPKEVEKKLLEIIPKKYLLDAHHLLLLHGRFICKARKPLCEQCCIRKWCSFYTSSCKSIPLN